MKRHVTLQSHDRSHDVMSEPRTWWKDLEDDVRAHIYNMVALSRK